LSEFTSFLFDIHGQHEHQALLKLESHRLYLDRFAGLTREVAAFAASFMALSEKKKALRPRLLLSRDGETKNRAAPVRYR
jgi:DNA repair protein RecN (Recombination protein N)